MADTFESDHFSNEEFMVVTYNQISPALCPIIGEKNCSGTDSSALIIPTMTHRILKMVLVGYPDELADKDDKRYEQEFSGLHKE